MTTRKPKGQYRGESGDSSKGQGSFHRYSKAIDSAEEDLWIYGQHATLLALANARRQKRRLLATPEARRRLAEELEPLADQASLEIEELHRRDIERLLPEGAVHQGIAMLSQPLADLRLSDWRPTAKGRCVIVALDQVTDPHNVGAVIRSAAAFGASALLFTRRHSPGETGVLAKTASGALECVPIIRETNLSQALESLHKVGFLTVGLAGEGSESLEDIPGDVEKICVVLGAEGKGLRQKTRETCKKLVRLPTRPPIDQLNVSNAAAIALYELLGRSG